MPDDLGIDKAADIKVRLIETIQLDQRADTVVGFAGEDRDLVIARGLQRPHGQHFEFERETETRLGQHAA